LSVCQEETAIRCSNSIHKQNKNQTFIQSVTRKNGNGLKNEQKIRFIDLLTACEAVISVIAVDAVASDRPISLVRTTTKGIEGRNSLREFCVC
jgi:hypothetical protein